MLGGATAVWLLALAGRSQRCRSSGFGASPWSNPLNGMDYYAGDLAGFSDSDDAFDNNLDQVSLDL